MEKKKKLKKHLGSVSRIKDGLTVLRKIARRWDIEITLGLIKLSPHKNTPQIEQDT